MAAQLQGADTRLRDYPWAATDADGLVLWATVNRFCGDCAVIDCPVFIRLANKGARAIRPRLLPEQVAIQAACPFVEEYREARAALRPAVVA
jgi:hypothetical protein